MEHVKTINDCLTEALKIGKEAKQVTNREEHVLWWNNKVELLKIINNALETGYWVGEAYNTLWAAKNELYRAETTAGGWYKG